MKNGVSNNPQVVPVRQFSVAHLREEAEGCCFIASFFLHTKWDRMRAALGFKVHTVSAALCVAESRLCTF